MKKLVSSNLRKFTPLILSIVALWVIFLILLFPSIKNNQGNLVYCLDDAYIHMAIAKNFAQYGIWGITQYHFTSSSSSLLWTLLLSLSFVVFGVSEIVPLVLNLTIATLLLAFVYYWLEKMGYGFYQMVLILLAFVFFIPMHYLIFIGLEHSLQFFLNLLFVVLASRIISGGGSEKRIKQGFGLGVLALLVVMVRFEGLFLVLVVSVLLLVSKRILNSMICLISGFFPVLIYGLISLSQGWYFLPNSVLLKGTRPDISTISGWLNFISRGLRHLVYNIHIFILVLMILLLLSFWARKFNTLKGLAPTMGFIVVVTVVLHLFFARSGFYLNYYFGIRYDAYLLGLELFSVLALLIPLIREKRSPGFFQGIIKILLIVVLALPLAERGIRTVVKINQSAHNTFIYQYQMARFLEKFYQGNKVVLNDIGAASYFADIKFLDILALGSKEVGDLILKNQYSSQSIFNLAADFGACVAIINEVLLQDVGGAPTQWFKVAQWKISKSVISNLNVLSFYALNVSEIPQLLKNLKRFSEHLPDGVEQKILLKVAEK